MILQTLYMLLECCGDRRRPRLTEVLPVVVNQLLSMLHEKCQPVTKHNEDAEQYIPVVTAIEGHDRLFFFLFVTQMKQNFKIQKRQLQENDLAITRAT